MPFIVYTATFTEPKDEQLAFTLGADAFLVKPLDPEELVGADSRGAGARGQRRVRHRSAPRLLDETVLLQAHNAVLIDKLEQKASQLETTNRELLAEIAEHKRTEAELRESEERFRATFEQAAVGIAHVDLDGRFLRVNRRLCEMTGYPGAELLQLTFQALTAADDRDAGDAARLAMLARTQQVYSAEKRYLNKAGEPFWAGVVTTLLWDQSGAPKYFITVLIDITERKALEDQLRQAQKMEAVGRLAGGVAHDFNNLLTVISGYGEMLLATPVVSDLDREALKAISEAGERAAALTRQLLGFSRQTILQPKVLDLNEVVAETARLLRRLIGEDIQLVTTLATDLRQVRVDPGQLEQVLMNLAVNARDAMPTGGRLTIETANVVLDDDPAVVPGRLAAGRVRDAGGVRHGLRHDAGGRGPDLRAVLHDQGRRQGNRPRPGDGLRHRQAERRRHPRLQRAGTWDDVQDLSARGRRADGGGQERRRRRGPARRRDHPAGRRRSRRARAGDRQPAALRLQRAGCRRTATRRWAVAQATPGPSTSLLADVVMPNLGGPKLAERLRERFPGIKVLFMSGYTDDAVVRHGLLNADAPFIQKPYTPLGLAQKVRQVLDGAS